MRDCKRESMQSEMQTMKYNAIFVFNIVQYYIL